MPLQQAWGHLSVNCLEAKRLKNYQEFLKLAPVDHLNINFLGAPVCLSNSLSIFVQWKE